MNENNASSNSHSFLDRLEKWAAWAETQLVEKKASEALKN